MRQLSIEECHVRLLNMAKEMHKICVNHNIPYYMLGGTMLGAIRHKGIIPWDDDMDFGIPRQDYERFVKYAADELPSQYKMLTPETSDYGVLGIGKISDTTTIANEIYAVKTSEKLGVNIDIFPLDYTDSNVGAFSVNWFVRRLFKFQKLIFMETQNRTFLKRMLGVVCQFVFRFKKTTIPQFINKMMLTRNVNVTRVANLFGAWDKKEVVPVEYFGEPTLYKFSDTEFYGVQDYDSYLKMLYNDYMQLPPEEKRHIHSLDMYVK